MTREEDANLRGLREQFFSLRLCLVLRKFEGKCKGKKIQRKNKRKEKVKENKK